MTAVPDAPLAAYLQRVVGDRGKTLITSVMVYESWAELPWDPDIGPPGGVLPEGKAALIGMRDVYLVTPGPEAFIALPYRGEPIVLAAMLAQEVIRVRVGGRGM